MKRAALSLFAALCTLTVAGGNAFADMAPPKVSQQLTAVPDHPYNEQTDAHKDVALGIARAAATHKYVLIEFGGNWCPDCRVTAGVLGMDEVGSWVDKTFTVVSVDVGRMNKNLDIAEAYGVKIVAVPTIIVLDPEGHMVNSGNPAALKDARGMTPQAIVDTLSGWIAKPS